VCAAAHAGRTHAVTVIAWYCEVLMFGTINRHRYRLTDIVSERRQLRQPPLVGGNAGGLVKEVNIFMKSGLIFVNLNYEKPQKYRD
jgi:hypothetical protein